jgi:hypothetical protein
MKAGMKAVLVTAALAGCSLLFVVMVRLALYDLQGRYPGSVRMAADHIQFKVLDGRSLSRQADFYSPDALLVVRHWYADRYDIDPASERNPDPTRSCIWLSRSRWVYQMVHSISILLCSAPQGTRIYLNERVDVYLWRWSSAQADDWPQAR